MAPILGIYASSNYQRVTPDSGAMFPIAMANVGSAGAAYVEFTSIPNTYKHLQLRMSVKADATTNGTPTLVYNNDTSSVYTYHHLVGNGSSLASYSPGANYGGTWFINGGQSADQYAAYVTDILDYTSNTKAKTIRTLAGFDNNGSGSIYLVSQAYINTSSAISSLKLTVQSGNISQFSQVALYGIKG